MPQQPSLSNRSSSPSSWHPTDYLRVVQAALGGHPWVPARLPVGRDRVVVYRADYEARTQLLIEKDAKRNTSISSVLEDRDSCTRTISIRHNSAFCSAAHWAFARRPAWRRGFARKNFRRRARGRSASAAWWVRRLAASGRWWFRDAGAHANADASRGSESGSPRVLSGGRQHSRPAHRDAGSQLPRVRPELPVG